MSPPRRECGHRPGVEVSPSPGLRPDVREIEAAAALVHRHGVGPTPQYAWPLLSARLGTTTWVKHENHLPTGAFKVRGGLVYVDRGRRAGTVGAGLVSATRGNHGQSLAFAGRRFGIPVTVVVPEGNASEKNAAMRALGARVVEHGHDFDEARQQAAAIATDAAATLVPSFHADLVLGVSTYAWELLTAVPDLDRLYVPVGLGSGICGCIAARDALGARCRIIGVQAAAAPSYALSWQAGRVITTPTADTRADGVATRVPDPQALEVIMAGAEDVVTVDDAEVAEAIRSLWRATHNLAEGAGACALAAASADRRRPAGASVAVVLSGGNIDLDLFVDWVGPAREGGSGQV